MSEAGVSLAASSTPSRLSGHLLTYVEFPQRPAEPLVNASVAVESLVFPSDPSKLVPLLLKQVQVAWRPASLGCVSSSSSSPSHVSDQRSSKSTSQTTSGAASCGGQATPPRSASERGSTDYCIQIIPTADCCVSNVPLFLHSNHSSGNNSEATTEGLKPQRNTRAETLFSIFRDKFDGRVCTPVFYGNVAVFWRDSVDPPTCQIKLACLTVSDVKKICPPLFAPLRHGVSACPSSSSLVEQQLPSSGYAIASQHPSELTNGVAYSGGCFEDTPLEQKAISIEQFLSKVAAQLPTAQTSLEALLQHALAMKRGLAECQNEKDRCMRELAAARQASVQMRETIDELRRQVHSLKAENAELNRDKRQSEGGNADSVRRTADEALVPESRRDSSINEDRERTQGSSDLYRVIQVYDAQMPDTTDNSTMWGRFEEGELVTVQEKTDGGWWYVVGSRDQRGWYPRGYLTAA